MIGLEHGVVVSRDEKAMLRRTRGGAHRASSDEDRPRAHGSAVRKLDRGATDPLYLEAERGEPRRELIREAREPREVTASGVGLDPAREPFAPLFSPGLDRCAKRRLFGSERDRRWGSQDGEKPECSRDGGDRLDLLGLQDGHVDHGGVAADRPATVL
jgi:hypothetical protein